MAKAKLTKTIDVYPEDTMWKALMQVLDTERKQETTINDQWKKRRRNRRQKRQGR